MDDQPTKRDCNDPGAMSYTNNSSHDRRRASTFSGTNALTTNLKEQQSTTSSPSPPPPSTSSSSSSPPSLTRVVDAASRESHHTLGMPSTPDSEVASPPPSPVTPPTRSSSTTPDDIDAMLRDILHQHMDATAISAYFDAELKPPITHESLAELDMPRIINNPKLRHDVNFDRELHFRPNLDGLKGRQKAHQAKQYWKALEVELFLYSHVSARATEDATPTVDWASVLKQTLRRLEGIFKAIREIMKTLVPDYDQKAVDDRLDVEHVMRQIQNGVCDLIDLANWLAKILKRHCAPMRDPLVDKMRSEIESGVHAGKNAQLVGGLSQLMTILEAMKLDVANHQIRHMRPLLIEDTVNFQRRYNEHRIRLNKIRPLESKSWLEREMQTPYFAETSTPLTPLNAYCSALIRDVVFNSDDTVCPPAFYLDADRLQSLRIEIHTMIYHDICRDAFQELAGSAVSATQMLKMYEGLHASISAIVGTRGKFVERPENIAVQMVRVLRGPSLDGELLRRAETMLKERLQPQSDSFKATARKVCGRIIPKLRERVSGLEKKSAIDLHNELVPIVAPRPSVLGFGAICEPAPIAPTQPADPDEDLVRRVGHMLVLHWQVWAPLVYLIDDQSDDADDASSESGGRASPPARANTVPVAQAVYAPGRKWLPVGVRVTDVPNQQLPTPSPSPSPEASQSAPSGNTEATSEDASNVDSPSHRQPA